jgi:hypothetical protein
LTASFAAPAAYPRRFLGCVLFAATGAMLAAHVGPATLAARFGNKLHWPAAVVLGWLGIGYLAALLFLVRAGSPGFRWLILIAPALTAGLVWAWWKPLLSIELLIG